MTTPRVPLLTVTEVAEILRASRTTVFRLLRDGHLKAIRLRGRHTLIRQSDVDRFIERGINN